ncbi:MAG: TIGR03936 family radical SAM-associated protein [Planctomycetota bacterium]
MQTEPASSAPDNQTKTVDQSSPLRVRYRIRFSKAGLLRWTSHRDLARLWERLLRRAQLKLSMSEGFHPKPRIGFPSALALGTNGLNEVVELDLAESPTAVSLLEKLRRDEQPGLSIHSVQRMPEGFGKAKLARTVYCITFPDPDLAEPGSDAADVDRDQLNGQIQTLLERETVSVQRKKKTLTANVSRQILGLTVADRSLELSLAASDSATLKPTDILDLIGCSDWISLGSQITRTAVVLDREVDSPPPDTFAQSNEPPPMR